MERFRPLLIAACLSIAAWLGPSAALACKCMLPSVEQNREQASAVFEGRVSKIEDVAPSVEGGVGSRRVSLAVVRTWKGLENVESVAVTTSASSASCGYDFQASTSYLVYATGSENALEVISCSRTRPMSEAGEDLSALGAGITPVAVKPAAPSEPSVPKTAPKSGGCGSVSGSAQASAAFMLLPATGLALGARRRRVRRS